MTLTVRPAERAYGSRVLEPGRRTVQQRTAHAHVRHPGTASTYDSSTYGSARPADRYAPPRTPGASPRTTGFVFGRLDRMAADDRTSVVKGIPA
ncbi:hypothetical protein ACIRQY_12695 [Streptomyces sp. NPDC101490]|uniref:hypothetical protein n=1 Tax=Streptomyces sp. NPDC101490 TaxID=3366143 RepID=UPI0037FC2C8A